MAKRKYEQGGGVVPCVWQKGAPSEVNEYGVVLMEHWTLGWGWREKPEVTASIAAYVWDREAKEWRSVRDHFTPEGRCARWMRVAGTVSADLSLTLEEWPDAR